MRLQTENMATCCFRIGKNTYSVEVDAWMVTWIRGCIDVGMAGLSYLLSETEILLLWRLGDWGVLTVFPGAVLS